MASFKMDDGITKYHVAIQDLAQSHALLPQTINILHNGLQITTPQRGVGQAIVCRVSKNIDSFVWYDIPELIKLY